MTVEKSKKKANPQGKRVEVELDLPLTTGEKDKRGKRAWELLKQSEELTLEKKEVSNEFSAKSGPAPRRQRRSWSRLTRDSRNGS